MLVLWLQGLACFIFYFYCFFFNDTATTEIYTLSLHDALPISPPTWPLTPVTRTFMAPFYPQRSEEHTSELQSRLHLVCRLLLEKKKNILRKMQAKNCKLTYGRVKCRLDTR